MTAPKVVDELAEARDEDRTERIHDAVMNTIVEFRRSLKTAFALKNEPFLRGSHEDKIMDVLHEIAEETVGAIPYLDHSSLCLAILTFLPSGFAHRVELINDIQDHEPELWLHLDKRPNGLGWQIFLNVDQGWCARMVNGAADPGEIETLIELGFTHMTSRERAHDVAAELLDKLGWPRYPVPKSAMAEPIVPTSLIMGDTMTRVFNSVGL